MRPIVRFGLLAALLAPIGSLPVSPPLKPEPDPMAKICDQFGPGFELIPGTSTCIRISGSVRMDIGSSSSGK